MAKNNNTVVFFPLFNDNNLPTKTIILDKLILLGFARKHLEP